MKKIKLNVGAHPRWSKLGWHTIDHKITKSTPPHAVTREVAREVIEDTVESIVYGTASDIQAEDNSCSIIFSSHMFEHIPHSQIEYVLLEFNRVLELNGVLRILTPDLLKLATAYVNRDEAFYDKAISEDENIRTDLGLGGSFMNFIVSPGQDTALFDRNLSQFISGYAHLYSYDFEMLSILLKKCGFGLITQKNFCESTCVDLTEPLRPSHLPPVWEDMNQEYYKKYNLIHKYDVETKKYICNFELTGFDRDPLTSLIIECQKIDHVDKEKYMYLSESLRNYERYGKSLLGDDIFRKKLNIIEKL